MIGSLSNHCHTLVAILLNLSAVDHEVFVAAGTLIKSCHYPASGNVVLQSFLWNANGFIIRFKYVIRAFLLYKTFGATFLSRKVCIRAVYTWLIAYLSFSFLENQSKAKESIGILSVMAS